MRVEVTWALLSVIKAELSLETPPKEHASNTLKVGKGRSIGVAQEARLYVKSGSSGDPTTPPSPSQLTRVAANLVMLPKQCTGVLEDQGDCQTESKFMEKEPLHEVKRSSTGSIEEDSCHAAKRVRNVGSLEPGSQVQDVDNKDDVLSTEKNSGAAHIHETIEGVSPFKNGLSLPSEEAAAPGLKGLRPHGTWRKPLNQLNITIEADAAEDKGSRHTMEDAWVVCPDASLGRPGKLRCAHFAIYDGHGGRQAAEYARAHLHANVISAGLPRELVDIKATKKAIIEGFKKTDEALLRESTTGGWQDGATAVSVWILGHMVFVANIGDAKAVLARTNTNSDTRDGDSQRSADTREISEKEPPLKGVTVTREHKAIFPLERARILKAGGFVGDNGRLLGRLEVSRAFGDRQFKKVGVSATPDVHSFELSERERFLILGCDGLWGVFGPSDAVEFVDTQLKEGVSVGVACRRLVREAVRERRCKDNCTAVLIVFKRS